jgi:hypothetical protein
MDKPNHVYHLFRNLIDEPIISQQQLANRDLMPFWNNTATLSHRANERPASTTSRTNVAA